MHNKKIIITGVLTLSLIMLGGCTKNFTPQVCVDEHCFNVEIADNQQSREKGLMFRQHLADDDGMIFVFDHADTYTFWMQNTVIPLDMIRIDGSGSIVDIQTATPCTDEPCPTYPPKGPASYVLEINANKAKDLGIQIGDQAKIEITQ